MAVKIINRLYNEVFTNGQTDWLLGNVGEWQELTLDVEASIVYLASVANPVIINYVNNSFTLASGKKWGDFGFDNGMLVTFKYKHSIDTNSDGTYDDVTAIQQQFLINNIYGSTMEVSGVIDGKEFENVPVNYGSQKISEVEFYVDKIPEGCRVKYGHVTNEDFQTKNLASFIDGSVAEFVRPELGSLGVSELFEAVGLQSGMSVRTMGVTYNGKKSGTNNVYKFEIKIKFMISSLFEDVSNFDPVSIPSYLNGDGSLTDNFIIEFYPEWNNPNVKIKNELERTERLGNTGWFNENFNQLPNDYKIDSIEYFDVNGNPVDSFDYSSATKVKAIISGVPNLNAQTECGFGFAWIPSDIDEIKELKSPFYQNVFVQSGDLDDGFLLDTVYNSDYIGAGINGASMDASGVKFTNLNGRIVMEATLTPNANFFTIFDTKDEDDRSYIFWISVADGQLERNFSDRVSLLADFSEMTKNIPPAGKYPYIDNAFLEHPFDDNATGDEVYQGIVQDDILCRLPFRIPNDQSTTFQKMTFGVKAYNIGLNKTFDLERFDVDLTTVPIDANGVQQFNIDTIRGFKLEPGNNKNWVKIERNSDLDIVGFNGYLAYFGTKIRWEDWILNSDAPSEFFDATKLNDGFNNDWIDYLTTNGWDIRFFTEIVATENDDLTLFENDWKFSFADYDENTLVLVGHKYFRDSDDTLLNIGADPDTGKPLGVILNDEETRIEIDFTIQDIGTWDLPNTYGVITIEIDFGAGRFEQRQLSSVWGYESDNPLKPLTGETKLKMEIDGTSKILTTSCVVDPELLAGAERYRITGRVGCFDTSGAPFVPGLYEFRYEDIYQ